MTDERLNRDKDAGVGEQKRVAYYSTLINAWVQSRMERDKSLLSLSAAGIALLVTLLTTVGVKTCLGIMLYAFAFLFFFATLLVCLAIYRRNAKHLAELASNPKLEEDRTLKLLDRFSYWFFIIGVFLAIAIAVVSWGARTSN